MMRGRIKNFYTKIANGSFAIDFKREEHWSTKLFNTPLFNTPNVNVFQICKKLCFITSTTLHDDRYYYSISVKNSQLNLDKQNSFYKVVKSRRKTITACFLAPKEKLHIFKYQGKEMCDFILGMQILINNITRPKYFFCIVLCIRI